jgi:hypothetical protein
MNFIEFIAQLAPEGETMLFVRQKQTAKGYTYIPRLPERYKPGGAWYGNTGSFILDRFEDGKPRAAREYIERVAVLMLDDIGTKSKAPPIEPTWKMETSPGNYQWGYVFRLDDQPTKYVFTPTITAIAAAGFTDPGATNCVRNFRLPGSANLRKGNFESRLVEFHPEREFSLQEICAALGVQVQEGDAQVSAVQIEDDGNDDVLRWLSDEGMVLERPNSSGWAGVVCPNASEHSNDDPQGRYYPLTRAYKCLHAHCADWGSDRFLKWVAEQGGPAQEYGLRDELLAAKMAGVLDAIQPTDAFPDDAARIIEEVARKELGRLERDEWYARFAYLQDDDAYFDRVDRIVVSRGSFNALYRHITCRSVRTNRVVEASVCFDENRQKRNAAALRSLTYAPGESVICTRDGYLYGNRWRDMRPTPVAGPIDMWEELLHALLPNQMEREHVLNVMAFKVQNPSVKVNHAVLMTGGQGQGKDTLWAPMLWAIGGDTLTNIKHVKNEELTSQWGYSLEVEVMVIEELRQTEAKDRRALENQLKTVIAAPPEYLSINKKGLHPYEAINRLFVLAFSNERAAITLPSDDRRWFVTWSDSAPIDGKPIWDWYKYGGGRSAVAAHLYARDVSAFDPGARPPMTDAKILMGSASLSPAEAWLVDQINRRAGIFASGAVAGPWQGVCEVLQPLAPHSIRLVAPALLHALREAGWKDYGRLHSRAYPSNRHVIAAPELSGLPKSDIRAAVEPGLRAVK